MWNFLKGRLIFVRICLLAAVLALVAIGIATIYSVGHPAESSPVGQAGDLANYWKKQLVFAALAMIAFLAANAVSYRRFGPLSYWMYAFVILLLGILLLDYVIDVPFVPLIEGHTARRWMRIGTSSRYLQFQPSELCKLVYVLALAWYLRYRSNYRSLKSLVGPFLLTMLPMVLIFAEPDLRTVLLMMPILFVMLFVAGARLKHLLTIALIAVLLSPILWYKMRPYQRTRISCVLLQSSWIREKAEQHPTLGKILVGANFSTKKWKSGWGYQLVRSKFAVASGGPGGYGFREGPFIKYNFLPERHNDFIFAVIAHQWGFWGGLVVLGLYAIIAACGLEIAANNTDPYGRLIAVGIVVTFTVEVIVNVAMTVGLMPITGLTLPFVSYGGSSLLVSMASVGVLNNVGRFRPFTVAPKK
jgi:cell division protein FtsW (lipid II flippase)